MISRGYNDIGVVKVKKKNAITYSVLAAVFPDTGNCSSKIVHGRFFFY